MNIEPLTGAQQAAFRRVITRGEATPILNTLNNEERGAFGASLAAMLVSDVALASGPSLVNQSPLTAGVKNAFDKLFNIARVEGDEASFSNAFTLQPLLWGLLITVPVGIYLGWRMVKANV